MTTLSVFYDLERGPVSFDFVTFLCRAMLERDRRGCSRLHIVVAPNEGGLAGFARHGWGDHDAADTLWRFWHICAAACPLAEATLSIAPTRAHALAMRDIGPSWWPEEKRFYMAWFMVDAARAGERIPRLRATPAARRIVETWLGGDPRTLITITLRRQTTQPERNTDEREYRAVADYFRGCGARVEILDDTMRALEDGRGFAELDPDLRLALYEAAELNIVGNNGPSVLLHYSKANYLQLGVAQPAEVWAAHYRDFLKLEWGEQWPWAHTRQHMVWEVLPAERIIRLAEQLLEAEAP